MKLFYSCILLLAAAMLAVGAAAQQTVAPASSDKTAPKAPANPADEPLFDVPPMPQGKVSLVGGTVTKIDRVRNRLWLRPFGGGTMTMSFDERSHIYRDGVETTQLGIRKGDRVYVDTMLDGDHVFARNVRVENEVGPADARGQVVGYDPKTGAMTVLDELSSQDVTVRVTPSTVIRQNNQPAAARTTLRPGTLIAIQFAPDRTKGGVAQQISIIAVPGTAFVFDGVVTYLDLHLGTLALTNRTDNKSYELHFSPGARDVADNVTVGADVTINAVFDGAQYKVNSLTVNQAKRE